MNNYEDIIIYDTTLRDGEQSPGFGMNSMQKLEIAKMLEKMNVDIIEAGFPASSRGDFKSVRAIAEEIRTPVISALARCVRSDIISAGESLKPAIERNKGKIHVFIATSDLHIEKKLNKSKAEIIQTATRGVDLARKYTELVEFSCEDFARSDMNYTVEIIKEVIKAGANTINLPDTAGYRFPSEIESMVREVVERVGVEGIIYSMHAHNDLGQATANTLYAIKGGTRQAEVTLNGIGERAGNASLEEVVAAISERPDFFEGIRTNIITENIIPASNLVSKITGRRPQANKSIVGENAFAHSSGVHTDGILKCRSTYEWIPPEKYGGESRMILTARSGRSILEASLMEKKISYDKSDLIKIAERFKSLADGENEIHDDLLVLSARDETIMPEPYSLVRFESWLDGAGGHASVFMDVSGEKKKTIGNGNGMIHAAEIAIKELIGLDFEIVNYESRSASKGADSKGIEEVIIKKEGYLVKGVGIADDTVLGAAYALVDAANKMIYVLKNR